MNKFKEISHMLRDNLTQHMANPCKKNYSIAGEDLPEEMKEKTSRNKYLVGFVLGILLVLVINYFISSFFTFFQEVNRIKEGQLAFNFLQISQVDFSRVFSPLNILRLYSWKLLIPYGFLVALVSMVGKSKLNFGSKDQIAYGQKGDSRFTTIKEIKEQYKEIPDTAKDYPGGNSFKGIGGIPISHYKRSYFIDTDTTNTLINGASRSGKGELLVTPFIDILSRAEIQCSMVNNDPKGELYASSKDTLEARGYDVQVLNIQDPMQSMSYNPLQLVKEAWLEGNPEEASKRANSIAFTLYNDPQAGDNAFFNETAQSAVTAIILSLVEYCVDNGCPEKITMGNVSHLLNELGTINWSAGPGQPEKNALDEWFKALPQGHVAKKRYGATSFAGSKTRGSILATANNGLQPFVDPQFVKMTSRSSIELKQIGFPKYLRGQLSDKYVNQRLIITFIKPTKPLTVIKQYRQKIKAGGHFNLNFDEFVRGPVNKEKGIQDGDFLHIRLPHANGDKDGELLYKIHFVEERDQDGRTITERINGKEEIVYKRKVQLRNIEVQNPINGLRQLPELYYSNKPTAVFMIIPDYDSSNHALSSIFVKQLYTTLAQTCVETEGNKTFKRVQFILDEFGNMPPIDDMDQVMTVSLGRNILFNLFVQSFSQLSNKYGDNITNTIKDNCQNWIYIMSKNKDTIQEFVDAAGKKTSISINTNGESPMSLDKNLGKNNDEDDLITLSRLTQLIEGETLVIRSLHRQDLKRQKVRPFPIFNTKETTMPYRYQFLYEWIDTSKSLNDMDIHSDHTHLTLEEITIDATDFIVEEKIRKKYQNADKKPINPHHDPEKEKEKTIIRNINNIKNLIKAYDDETNDWLVRGLSEKIDEIIKEKNYSKILDLNLENLYEPINGIEGHLNILRPYLKDERKEKVI
ncbi:MULTISPECIES: VirD4-like conjugal transfer protein, CD1115 family [Aerococcus]|uniref:Type IV secretory system conjugative DNA transfer family protein n=2 Tax=Aerococcus TaxID=1375 RepID=A0ABZ2EES9_9LACT|nr:MULTISPECIES: type IV secretory system conjugative DNA transfer family protein [Aerococcus]MDK6371005.1 type IV secretory system conjugative DNA transfer family protein [Aerococcus urinae]MDK6472791.1 type IV secretory system conjugative DNA transfer family protein [Aerococcus urinae]MDK6597676.1 type IV secretory system conjugative DNA transfer family protein [Aerococcus urinae]MDK6652470.1 type IV secretory system conjugative DNA transfer family protein [Aerococcus urinae]MDK7195031.1 typ